MHLSLFSPIYLLLPDVNMFCRARRHDVGQGHTTWVRITSFSNQKPNHGLIYKWNNKCMYRIYVYHKQQRHARYLAPSTGCIQIQIRMPACIVKKLVILSTVKLCGRQTEHLLLGVSIMWLGGGVISDAFGRILPWRQHFYDMTSLYNKMTQYRMFAI